MKRHNVVVTGFGPFRSHAVNPSWEAIKDEQFVVNRHNVNIITKQVNVVYGEVDQVVESLWREHEPILMVHIGLSALEKCLKIEKVARLGPYLHNDTVQHAPHKDLRVYDHGGAGSLEEGVKKQDYVCKPCEFDSISTCIDVDKVCEIVNKAHLEGRIPLEARKSEEAGLYLCEYIYQKSLAICDRSIFIHIPNTDEFRIEGIRSSIAHTIEVIIDQVLSSLSP